MTVITVPDNYGWVLAAATSYIFVNLWQGIVVSSKRKASKVLYPQGKPAAEEKVVRGFQSPRTVFIRPLYTLVGLC